MNFQGCTALITGASAGLGTEFARQLAGNAQALVLVARRKERLEELQDELTKRNPKLIVHVQAADLSKAEEVEALCAWLEEQKIPIDLLINNAGLGDHGLFSSSDPARVNDMLQVNVVALTMLTRRFLPPMIAAKRGGILNVSSSASFLPLARLGVYAATKAYVTSFSEAIRLELHGSGVNVTALCPGPVDTEFSSVAARTDGKNESAPAFVYVSAEKVVRIGLDALRQNRPLVVPGLPIKLAMFLVRLTPLPILRLTTRISR